VSVNNDKQHSQWSNVRIWADLAVVTHTTMDPRDPWFLTTDVTPSDREAPRGLYAFTQVTRQAVFTGNLATPAGQRGLHVIGTGPGYLDFPNQPQFWDTWLPPVVEPGGALNQGSVNQGNYGVLYRIPATIQNGSGRPVVVRVYLSGLRSDAYAGALLVPPRVQGQRTTGSLFEVFNPRQGAVYANLLDTQTFEAADLAPRLRNYQLMHAGACSTPIALFFYASRE